MSSTNRCGRMPQGIGHTPKGRMRLCRIARFQYSKLPDSTLPCNIVSRPVFRFYLANIIHQISLNANICDKQTRQVLSALAYRNCRKLKRTP